MPTELEFAAWAFAVIFAVLMFYGLIIQGIGDYPARLLLRVTTDRFQVAQRYSTDELDSILRLSIAGLMQLAFCGVLIILSGIKPA
jgi:hypothetical protein